MFLDGLFPHQQDGVRWLLNRPRAMLAWEMGTGKTATLIRAWENSQEHGPLLVLCLASARENWRREVARFAIDPDLIPRAQVLKTTYCRIDPAADVVITNYEKLLTPAMAKQLRAFRRNGKRWGALVPDEARRLKNPTAQTTKLVYGGGHPKQTPLIQNAERVWCAEGTPMPNNPAELWTHCYYLWPESIAYRGRPMDLWEYELRYCEIIQGDYGRRVVAGLNLPELRERVTPYLNRVKRCDVLNLPPLQIDSWPLDSETTSGVGKLPDAPELLSALVAEYGPPANIEVMNFATLHAYLACICSEQVHLATIRRETSILKAIATAATLSEEFDESDAKKTVVFAHHRDAIAVLTKALDKWGVASVHGGTRDANAEIDRFQTDPNCNVFVGQLQAAGSSINLQAAEQVMFAEASWTPGENDQALSRVYRAGQTKPVHVRFAYLPGSIDEAVNRALARKAAMIAQVIN